MQQQQSMGIV